MKYLKLVTALILGFSNLAYAEGPTKFQIPFNNQLIGSQIEGNVQIQTTSPKGPMIDKNFYGADTNGFSRLPSNEFVSPLNLGYVKFGGNLHSVFNWNLNKYLESRYGISNVYAPLVDRIEYVQNVYQATPMFQINMLGWQPDYDSNGNLKMMQTADANHAANAIQFLNGTNQLGLKHILMGNEPFLSTDTHGIQSPSADEYIEKYIQYAVALREGQIAAGGRASDLKLWGPEMATGWTGWQTNHPKDCIVNWNIPGGVECSYGNGKFTEFVPYFLSRIAAFENDKALNPKGYKMLDYLTWHYYPLFRNDFNNRDSVIVDNSGSQNVAAMLESVNVWTSPTYVNRYDSSSPKRIVPNILNKFKNWRNQYYPNAQLGVTEFGIDSANDIAYHPIVRPLYLADLMPRLAEGGLNHFFNSFLQGRNSGDKWGMINNEGRTHLYYVYSLFSNNFKGQVVSTKSTAHDKVTVYSVKTATGTNVFFINKDTKEHNTAVNIVTASGEVRAAEMNLPAWSLTFAKIPDNKSNIEVEQYGAKEMRIPLNP